MLSDAICDNIDAFRDEIHCSISKSEEKYPQSRAMNKALEIMEKIRCILDNPRGYSDDALEVMATKIEAIDLPENTN